jgi:hypothetical protein
VPAGEPLTTKRRSWNVANAGVAPPANGIRNGSEVLFTGRSDILERRRRCLTLSAQRLAYSGTPAVFGRGGDATPIRYSPEAIASTGVLRSQHRALMQTTLRSYSTAGAASTERQMIANDYLSDVRARL